MSFADLLSLSVEGSALVSWGVSSREVGPHVGVSVPWCGGGLVLPVLLEALFWVKAAVVRWVTVCRRLDGSVAGVSLNLVLECLFPWSSLSVMSRQVLGLFKVRGGGRFGSDKIVRNKDVFPG